MKPFKNANDVPMQLEDLEREYCRLTYQPYPIVEMTFVKSWMLFRVLIFHYLSLLFFLTDHLQCQLSVISQGIAARYARRQASSEVAWAYEHMFPVIGHLAKVVLEEAGHSVETGAKL